jgi:hypothetical protein
MKPSHWVSNKRQPVLFHAVRGAEEALKLINHEEKTGLELVIGLHAPPLSLRGSVERPSNRVGGRLGAARGHPRPLLRGMLRALGELGQAVGLLQVRRERGQAINGRYRHHGAPNIHPWHGTRAGKPRHEACPDERRLTGTAGADDERSREPVLARGHRQKLVTSLLDSKLAAKEDRAAVTVVSNKTRIRGALGVDVPNWPARDVTSLLKPINDAVFKPRLEVVGVAKVVGRGNIVSGLVAERAAPPSIQRLLLRALLVDVLCLVGYRARFLQDVNCRAAGASARRYSGLDLIDGAALERSPIGTAEPVWGQLAADAAPQDTDHKVEGLHGRDGVLETLARLVEAALPTLERELNMGGVNTAQPTYDTLGPLALGPDVCRR